MYRHPERIGPGRSCHKGGRLHPGPCGRNLRPWIFDSQEIQRAVWELLAGKYGISMDQLPEAGEFSMAAHKEEQYKKLAGILRENLDMDRIYGILDRRL